MNKRTVVVATALLVAGLAGVGCATGRAESGAANPTTSWSGGFIAAEDFEAPNLTVNVYQHPSGMEKWTPEQIAAYAQAGHSFGDLFYSRQDIQPSAERGAGDTDASPTNTLQLQLDAANALRAAAGLPPLDAEGLKKAITGP